MKKKRINFFGIGTLFFAALYFAASALHSFEKEDLCGAFRRYIQSQYMFTLACAFLAVVMVDLLLDRREKEKCAEKDEAKEQNEKVAGKEV